jgi:hypothetical protein
MSSIIFMQNMGPIRHPGGPPSLSSLCEKQTEI